MKCACLCGKEFEPVRSNQVYFNAEHRQRDKNRRWPRKRQSFLPVLSRNGRGARRKARTSGVPPLLGSQIAQSKPRTLLWETRGKFGPEFVNGVSRSVVKARGLVVAKFQLVGREQ
jgi:hypothetical protein